MNSSDIREPDVAESIRSQNIKFQIPIYQRLFVWGKNEINKLLEDLNSAYTNNIDNPYYIGVITVREQKDGTLEVVDGQQRLTFLTLYGCEMIRLNNDANWNSFVKNDDKLRVHYVGRQEDEDDIWNFLQNWTFKNNPNFKIFHECFEVFIKEKDISGLSKFIYNKAAFLINYLPKEYGPIDLNLYFEKMNSTGLQLTPLEQLKGRFAQYAKRWNDCIYVDIIDDEEVGDLGNEVTLADVLSLNNLEQQKKWQDIATKATSIPKIKHRIIKPELLILHTLRLLLNDYSIPIDERHLLEIFEQKLPLEGKEEFIKRLEHYSNWIDANIIHIREEQDNSNSPYSLGKDENNDYEDKFDDRRKFIQYQAMLFVSGYDAQEWILDVYRRCNYGEKTLDLQTLQEWDKDNCKLSDIRNWVYGQNLLQVFTRLEYCLWEYVCYPNSYFSSLEAPIELPPINLNEVEKDAIENYIFSRNNYSVEHFHPQTDANSCNILLWNTQYSEIDKKYNCIIPKDSFGNLALISAGRNSEYGNYSVAAKYDRIIKLLQENKRLESIKLLFMCKVCGGKDENWKPDLAELLVKWMYELLKHKGFIK